ncbi:type I toxin-antitoxin system Ibs family toxin, partial [Escherichia coli]
MMKILIIVVLLVISFP